MLRQVSWLSTLLAPSRSKRTVALDGQQQKVDYSCGDSSGVKNFTGFPFNLLMIYFSRRTVISVTNITGRCHIPNDKR